MQQPSPADDELTLRPARLDDLAAIERLIARSARALSVGYYTEAQVSGLVRHVFGADTQLIRDGTYYLLHGRDGGLAAAGGWSRRRTLYGGDRAKASDDPLLDPAREPARIRAFFVDPGHARRGLGRRLFAACLEAAGAAGFERLALVATLPGEPLYRALGFTADQRTTLSLPDGVEAPVIYMSRPMDLPAPAGAEP
jgi:GNAT superfamily N-acetyltransferase